MYDYLCREWNNYHENDYDIRVFDRLLSKSIGILNAKGIIILLSCTIQFYLYISCIDVIIIKYHKWFSTATTNTIYLWSKNSDTSITSKHRSNSLPMMTLNQKEKRRNHTTNNEIITPGLPWIILYSLYA